MIVLYVKIVGLLGFDVCPINLQCQISEFLFIYLYMILYTTQFLWVSPCPFMFLASTTSPNHLNLYWWNFTQL